MAKKVKCCKKMANIIIYRKQQRASHDLLLRAHGSHLSEALLGQAWRIRARLYLRRVDHIENERHEHERQQPRHDGGLGPERPSDPLADGGSREVGRERVGRHGGEEHGRGDDGGLEARKHEPGPELPLGAVAGARAACLAERLDEREKDATGARGDGGDGGGEERLGEDERVAEAERGGAEGGDEGVGDA